MLCMPLLGLFFMQSVLKAFIDLLHQKKGFLVVDEKLARSNNILWIMLNLLSSTLMVHPGNQACQTI